MLKELDDYDWAEAFGFAGEPDQSSCASPILVEGSEPVSLSPISREDVVLIYWIAEGERDEESWEGVFRLRDGRYLYLTAGCDYTGWD